MKSIRIWLGSLVTVCMFAAPSAFATSIDPTKVVASVEGLEEGIEQVTLLEDGRLQIKKQDGSVFTERVSEPALTILVDAAKRIANVKIETKRTLVVCMMMPVPKLSSLFVTPYSERKGFSGKPRFMLSPEGCWVTEHAKPKDEWALKLATELRAQLRILAIDAL